MPVDYALLLEKYMQMVRCVEGDDMMLHVNDSLGMNPVKFSAEEVAALEEIALRARAN